MKSLLVPAFVAGVGLAGLSSAQAMTPAPLEAPGIAIQVAGGCGPGWHRGPYGGCRRNYAQPSRHACARGWYLAPNGRCRPNGR